MKRTTSQSGFSFAEVLVAVSIFAITAAIAVPRASDLLAQYQLSSTTNTIAFEISRGRMQAVAQNLFVQLGYDSGRHAICRMTSPDQNNWTPSSCSDATNVVYLPQTTTLSAPSRILTFERTGMATSTIQIGVSNPAGSKEIKVNILGRVSISNGTDAAT